VEVELMADQEGLMIPIQIRDLLPQHLGHHPFHELGPRQRLEVPGGGRTQPGVDLLNAGADGPEAMEHPFGVLR
jgi:hypothetical protein